MTSEALFGLSILMNLVAWGIVALLFIWPRTGHRSLENVENPQSRRRSIRRSPARDCSE
jgi:hypothetical protein